MADTIRAFLAIDLNDPVRAWLAQAQARLRKIYSGSDVRWVDPSKTHVTIKFLGDTQERMLPKIQSVLEEATGRLAPFCLTAEGFGCFPNEVRPRVLWGGVRMCAELDHLHSDIDQSLHRLGIPMEDRPFSPHLTLGRVRDGLPPDTLRRIGSALSALNKETERVVFPADAVYLFRSTLQAGGAEYSILYAGRLKSP